MGVIIAISKHDPPTMAPIITPLGVPPSAESGGLTELADGLLVVGNDVVGNAVVFSLVNPIAELNTSIADNWPHGTMESTLGPVQFGEYQLVLGYLALRSRELNCSY